jgi:hypothetical protein
MRTKRSGLLVGEPSHVPPAVRARLKPLRTSDGEVFAYGASCGRSHTCPHSLGTVLLPSGPSVPWVIEHEDGYRGDAAGGYRILHRRHRTQRGVAVGRRDLSGAKLEPWARQKYGSLTERSIVGQRPTLPCRIVCRCGTPNDVEQPG